MQTGAIFDATEQYRYVLWREWDRALPKVGFVMLNPSRADAIVDDPTIRRCLGFARSWGYGALEIMNLFAFRTAQPQHLQHIPDPIGPENNTYLASLADRVDQIVLAWGNWGSLHNRDRAVLSLLQVPSARSTSLYCLGCTQQGHPCHPLYLKASTPLQLFLSW